MTELVIVPRAADGKFLPGGPGGPGRPRGMSHSEKVRALLEPERENLLNRVMGLTKSEDPHAAISAIRVCLERLAPAPKQEPERVEIPDLANARTVSAKAEAILRAVADGIVSPESGERILRMLDVVSRVVALDELERRVRALEGGFLPQEAEVDDLA